MSLDRLAMPFLTDRRGEFVTVKIGGNPTELEMWANRTEDLQHKRGRPDPEVLISVQLARLLADAMRRIDKLEARP